MSSPQWCWSATETPWWVHPASLDRSAMLAMVGYGRLWSACCRCIWSSNKAHKDHEHMRKCRDNSYIHASKLCDQIRCHTRNKSCKSLQIYIWKMMKSHAKNNLVWACLDKNRPRLMKFSASSSEAGASIVGCLVFLLGAASAAPPVSASMVPSWSRDLWALHSVWKPKGCRHAKSKSCSIQTKSKKGVHPMLNKWRLLK